MGHQSPSGTRCRCSIPTQWIPQSRTEALHTEEEKQIRVNAEEEQRKKMFWMKWGGFRSVRRTVWIRKIFCQKKMSGTHLQITLSQCLYAIRNIKASMDPSLSSPAWRIQPSGSSLSMIRPELNVTPATSSNLLWGTKIWEWSLDRLRGEKKHWHQSVAELAHKK